MTDLQNEPVRAVLSPHAIRSVRFARQTDGLHEAEVRAFLDRLAADIEAAAEDRARMRRELAELRDEVARLHQESPRPDDDEIRMEISVRAVELLSRAQQAADDTVAEAEQYARDLVESARAQYRDIVQRAQQAAREISDRAGDGPVAARAAPGAPAARPELAATVAALPDVQYVTAFARVAQVQLRAVVDALTQEVEKLGGVAHLPPPDDETVDDNAGSPAAEPEPGSPD
ncbi:MAG: DivIVA domain-containing protein [Actinomycetes bacterium]